MLSSWLSGGAFSLGAQAKLKARINIKSEAWRIFLLFYRQGAGPPEKTWRNKHTMSLAVACPSRFNSICDCRGLGVQPENMQVMRDTTSAAECLLSPFKSPVKNG